MDRHKVKNTTSAVIHIRNDWGYLKKKRKLLNTINHHIILKFLK